MAASLGHDDAARVRLGASPDTAPELLHVLASDPAVTVRAAVAMNQGTPSYVDHILSRDQDERVRELLGRKLANLVPDQSAREHERAGRQAYLTLAALVEDEAVRVRAAIADVLKDMPLAPRDMILRLAGDACVEVGDPVIRLSPLLTDEDLIALLAQPPTPATPSTVARRPHLTETVSDAIAACADSAAIRALLENKSAAIREATLDQIIASATVHVDWHEPLVKRPALSMPAAHALSQMVATQLLHALAGRSDLDPVLTTELQQRLAARLEGVGLEGPGRASGTAPAPGGAGIRHGGGRVPGGAGMDRMRPSAAGTGPADAGTAGAEPGSRASVAASEGAGPGSAAQQGAALLTAAAPVTDHMTDHMTGSAPADPGQAGHGQAGSGQAGSGQTGSGQTGSGQAGEVQAGQPPPTLHQPGREQAAAASVGAKPAHIGSGTPSLGPDRSRATEAALLNALRQGDAAAAAAILAIAAEVNPAVIKRAATLRSAKGMVSLIWKAGFSMRVAVPLQYQLTRLPPNAVMKPSPSGDFPLSTEEMRWHLDFLIRSEPPQSPAPSTQAR